MALLNFEWWRNKAIYAPGDAEWFDKTFSNIKQGESEMAMFDVMITKLPTKAEAESGAQEEVLVAPTQLAAPTPDEAKQAALVRYADKLKDLAPGRYKVYARAWA